MSYELLSASRNRWYNGILITQFSRESKIQEIDACEIKHLNFKLMCFLSSTGG